MDQNDQINLQDLAVKCQSKKELYSVLYNNWDAYLPPLQFANSSYVRGVVTGELRYFFNLFGNYSLAHLSKWSKDHSRSDDQITYYWEDNGVCFF